MADVTVTVATTAALPPGQLWTPHEGDEADALVRAAGIRDVERALLLEESLAILGRCTDPRNVELSRRAGLIVGGVQSGKTLSFTTVAALARDNGYQLVIIIAGTKENLLEQSRDRLAYDLQLERGDAHYRWAHHRSPRPQDASSGPIAADLSAALQSSADPADRKTVLITVMKNHTHMGNTAAVLGEVARHVDMSMVTALVIDDEADQATPNLRRSGESATYRNLRQIRDALPRHTLLEYTATPQAPLLVSLADEISPDFTYVLTPGADYTGGDFFFIRHRSTFMRSIPQGDLACLANPALGPPSSLHRALAAFFVGAAAAQCTPRGQWPSQRSMLVHPSQATIPQADFRNWIEQARSLWRAALAGDDDDRADLCVELLRPAYDDLRASVPDIASWDAILQRLPTVLAQTRIEEVNARGGRSSEVRWSEAYAWILVGGALMDRGFTVEGLTVTYMPRSLGVGNADTLQQRARFFGYKRSYAGFCRAWLEADVAQAFISYVTHEEAMRTELREVAQRGEPLQAWKRRFLLDASLQPTRQAAIRLPMTRQRFDDQWLQQRHVPNPPSGRSQIEHNLSVVASFGQTLDFSIDDDVSGPTLNERHERADVAIHSLLEGLLADLVIVDDDSAPFLALALALQDHLARHGDPGCTIYRMGGGQPRDRTFESSGRIKTNLFQGRSHNGSYAGDRSVHQARRLTVQLHFVRPEHEGGQRPFGNLAVPLLAVWTPTSLRLGAAIVQA